MGTVGTGGENGDSVVLEGRDVWKIGRGSWNDLILKDSLASRNHAMIQLSGADDFLLIDLGSRNGAAVNGKRVLVPTLLKHGDRIAIGQSEFVFEQPRVPAPKVDTSEGADAGDATMLMVESRLVSVLVIDIRDFTGLSQRVDEATLAQTVGTWIRQSGAILEEQESWAQKYIGDAIMSVWIHLADEPHAQVIRRVLVSLARILERTAALQSDFQLPSPIRLGAGVNTGLASIGNVGSSGFSDYTALGDGVNKAFRLESATKQIGKDLVVGRETFQYLTESSDVGSLFEPARATLKGYERPEEVYGTSFEQLPELLSKLGTAGDGKS
jgi:adenylate cyclase